jgi:hypothetical protein
LPGTGAASVLAYLGEEIGAMIERVDRALALNRASPAAGIWAASLKHLRALRRQLFDQKTAEHHGPYRGG